MTIPLCIQATNGVATAQNLDNRGYFWREDTVLFCEHDVALSVVLRLRRLWLIASSCAKFLVEKKGYPKELDKPFGLDKDFCTRGIVFDTESGDFLKLTEDGVIVRASHGTALLTEDQIREEYGEKRHWSHYEDFIDKVDNLASNRYRVFDNFFDMPNMVISARIVDILDKQAGERCRCYTFWSDVREAALDCYSQQNFADDRGGFFPQWKKDTGRYLYPCSDEVKQWLRKLKQNNKKLFILTSSRVDFAEASMNFVLGKDWQSYFDLTITNARKPGFFKKDKNRDFFALDGIVETGKVTELKEGTIYSQGNHADLMKFLSKITGKKEPKVLFFGDSLRSDIAPAKKCDWETVLILEEIESEQCLFDSGDEEPYEKRVRVANSPSQLEKVYLTSHRWGSFFTDKHPLQQQDDSTVKYMNTLWGYTIRKYADLAVPQLEYITDFPLDHKFDVFNHEKRCSWGFYPTIPKALQNDTDK
ncbi:5'-nucleotidase domain-containing protein 1 [Lamellibrachia satsuma]|nr:5'-nucleotidase domain-containing protein 1 [Lamellibrachia satsuma]